MGTKRPAELVDDQPTRPSHVRLTKKARRSPSADEPLHSSEPSSHSVSEDSALESSPSASRHAQHSSISSIEPSHDHESSGSSLESTSESEEDSSSEGTNEDDEIANEEDDIVTVGGPKKPSMAMKDAQKSRIRDLHGRLKDMLSQLAQANEDLEEHADVYNMENVEDDEAHIEMNLGLGVLEEIHAQASSSEDESTEDESSDAGESAPLDEGEGDEENLEYRTLPLKGSKRDAMSTLLGRDSDRQKADIEVLE